MRSVIFAILLGAACAASAQLYRWTDDQGRVHVTDTPPPPGAKSVQRKTFTDNSAVPAAGASLPYAAQLASKNYPVTLYTAPECAPCGAARNLLNGRGVPFKEVVNRTIRAGLGEAAKTHRGKAPKTVPHSFGFRPGVDLDKLGQLADELEADAFAASAERLHDSSRRQRSRSRA